MIYSFESLYLGCKSTVCKSSPAFLVKFFFPALTMWNDREGIICQCSGVLHGSLFKKYWNCSKISPSLNPKFYFSHVNIATINLQFKYHHQCTSISFFLLWFTQKASLSSISWPTMSVFVWSINAFDELLMSCQRENGRETLILNTFSPVWSLKTFSWKCSVSPAVNTSSNTPVITIWDFGEQMFYCFKTAHTLSL